MGDDIKTKSDKIIDNYAGIQTTDPNEWLAKIKENGDLIDCQKRSARMHIKHCNILRKAVPIVGDSGYMDKTLKSINICNDCEVTKQYLSVRRFIEFRNDQHKERLEND